MTGHLAGAFAAARDGMPHLDPSLKSEKIKTTELEPIEYIGVIALEE